ncbi:MAG: hypothetical protein Edafosvirus16_5 [Edafosvirus sp.]|uniref:Uncharacterized protein n=1 Tax=Edafosvirus sp. TaxID=2487765 RepID=A0A3G4ZUC0_9VIRU|nr:MAG: hypothetical protein Edafosvirus16_5 [Edafosvirus sp.]
MSTTPTPEETTQYPTMDMLCTVPTEIKSNSFFFYKKGDEKAEKFYTEELKRLHHSSVTIGKSVLTEKEYEWEKGSIRNPSPHIEGAPAEEYIKLYVSGVLVDDMFNMMAPFVPCEGKVESKYAGLHTLIKSFVDERFKFPKLYSRFKKFTNIVDITDLKKELGDAVTDVSKCITMKKQFIGEKPFTTQMVVFGVQREITVKVPVKDQYGCDTEEKKEEKTQQIFLFGIVPNGICDFTDVPIFDIDDGFSFKFGRGYSSAGAEYYNESYASWKLGDKSKPVLN